MFDHRVERRNSQRGMARTPVTTPSAQIPRQRPGIREIEIRSGGGNFYNGEPRQFPRYTGLEGLIRLHQDDGKLFLDLPKAEAVAPQRLHLVGLILVLGPNGPRTSHGDGHKRQFRGSS